MAGTPKRILRKLTRRLRSRRSPSEASLGQTTLPDGTVLERCVWMNPAELEQATMPSGQPQLFIHWRTDEADCIHDLPELREIHLFWAHHVDFVAICWDRVSESPAQPAAVAAAVDAWHRDYGLTWTSLIYDGEVKTPETFHHSPGEPLPQVILIDSRGEIAFKRVGIFAPDDHIKLRQILRHVSSL